MTDDRVTRVAIERWTELIGEAESLLDGYEAEGWETLLLHPGDVTPLSERDRCGFDLLVPGNEYEPLAALVEDRGVDFPASEVYSRREDEVVLLVVLHLDPAAEAAVAFPAYYDRGEAEPTFERAEEEGRLHTYLRKLSGETVVFSYDDPSIFRPSEGEWDR